MDTLDDDEGFEVPNAENHIELVNNEDDPVPEQDDSNEYNCDLCDWKPAPFVKDKERALKNHYKNKHPEYYKENFSTRRSRKKPEKITIIENTAKVVDEVRTADPALTESEERLMLLQDLDLFKVKFKDLNYQWKYNNDSSLEVLKREKSLFLRMINDEVGTKAIFNLLVVAGKSAERITGSLGIVDIEGYSNDLKEHEKDIIGCLKDMVDAGLISATALTPELRLAMILISIGVSRAETNRIEKKKLQVAT
jgi:hypothetical protein